MNLTKFIKLLIEYRKRVREGREVYLYLNKETLVDSIYIIQR